MQYIKDKTNYEIIILNNQFDIVSKLYFVPSYFVWTFSYQITKENPIVLSKEDDNIFYENLEWLMHESYSFPHNYSHKTPDKLIWLSEHCFNLQDEYELDITPRLIIEKKEDKFHIYFERPFTKKYNIPNNSASISFAPAGNGFLSKNNSTGTTFQDDLITVFYYTLNNQKINNNKIKKKKA